MTVGLGRLRLSAVAERLGVTAEPDVCHRLDGSPPEPACDRPGAGVDDARWRPLLGGSLLYRRAPNGARLIAAFVWLLFIIFPVLNAIGNRGGTLKHGLVIGGAVLFVVAYVTMVMTWRRDGDNRFALLLFSVLLSVSTVLTLFTGSGWGFLFTYCAACVGLIAPKGVGFYEVGLCAGLAGVCSAIAGANGGAVLGFVASSAGIGLLMLVMSDLRLRNAQLSRARAELARLAVAQERERFARDLHDLLGHSLSVIALKAELAGRMLTDRPFDAAKEVAELEQVARTALSEVREAVSGYRQPTLEGELAGARMALSAAGIEAEVEDAHVPLDPAVEAVLAWAIREGATNVIRHSGADHCSLRVIASLTDASVEVIDNGMGAAEAGAGNGGDGAWGDRGVGGLGGGGIPSPALGACSTGVPALRIAANGGGHGLAGLAERARLLNGTIEAGALAGGGYRLAVTVPVAHA
jgi:two-component system, NarL family, sensor histidine kinase DesK